MIYFNMLLALQPQRPDWTVLVGPEELLAATVLLGGHGGVNGGANLFPRLYVRLYEAARAGNLPRTRDLQKRVWQVVEKLYRIGRHPSAVIKGLKGAASCLGLCSDFMAEPFHRFREPERRRIEQGLEELKPLVETLD
jgi:4-hydroxy-tetrahydrodipicolinate synthase